MDKLQLERTIAGTDSDQKGNNQNKSVYVELAEQSDLNDDSDERFQQGAVSTLVKETCITIPNEKDEAGDMNQKNTIKEHKEQRGYYDPNTRTAYVSNGGAYQGRVTVAEAPPPVGEDRSQYDGDYDRPRRGSRHYYTEVVILFQDQRVRQDFIRKVYTILAVMLMYTFGFIALCIFEKYTRLWVLEHSYGYISRDGVITGMLRLCKESISSELPASVVGGESLRELENICLENDIPELFIVKSETNIDFLNALRVIRDILRRSKIKLSILKIVQVIKSKELRQIILNDFHLLPTSGHAGMNRIYYTWTGLKNSVNRFVQKCDLCQHCKHFNLNEEPLQITTTASSAFQKIFLDIVGPLPTVSENFKYILTIQCELTKYVEAYNLLHKDSETVAKAFVQNFIIRYGIPQNIATDKGSEFLKEKVDQHRCSSYYSLGEKFDVTTWGMYLCIAASIVVIYGFVAVMVYIFTGSTILYLIYSCLLCLLFSMFLMYDTQQVVGGKRIQLTTEEYILGALTLYADIITIFVVLLDIIGYCQ
nr:unnamed protein product [Callosobruchus chinensis]